MATIFYVPDAVVFLERLAVRLILARGESLLNGGNDYLWLIVVALKCSGKSVKLRKLNPVSVSNDRIRVKLTKDYEHSLLPLIAISAVVCGVLLFILGVAFGANFGNKEELIGGSISDWLTATATVTVTALTFILAKESWKLRILQAAQVRELQFDSIRPNIYLGLEGSSAGKRFVHVRIENIGKGIARDVTFRFYARDRRELSQKDDKVADQFFKLSIFRNGIGSIGVNQTISSFLFYLPHLSRELDGKLFETYLCIQVKFHDIEGRVYESEFIVDFAEFQGISEIVRNPIDDISTELKAIREQLSNLLQILNGRIVVDVFNKDACINGQNQI
jgi:hypothetical protein